jgi:hypothetical protein
MIQDRVGLADTNEGQVVHTYVDIFHLEQTAEICLSADEDLKSVSVIMLPKIVQDNKRQFQKCGPSTTASWFTINITTCNVY